MKILVKIVTLLVPIGVPLFLIIQYLWADVDVATLGQYLLILGVVSILVTVYYFVHLYRNKVTKNKVNWVFFLLFASNIAQVVYWFKYIKDE